MGGGDRKPQRHGPGPRARGPGPGPGASHLSPKDSRLEKYGCPGLGAIAGLGPGQAARRGFYGMCFHGMCDTARRGFPERGSSRFHADACFGHKTFLV